MKSFFEEFSKFINRGNVVDMAVGVIIGAAFNSIVTSLVNDIMMPVISAIVGDVSFADLAISIVHGENVINIAYGLFIQNIFNFLITALCLFVIVRSINTAKEKVESLKKKEEEKKEDEKPEPSAEVVLLTEIKDLLKKKAK